MARYIVSDDGELEEESPFTGGTEEYEFPELDSSERARYSELRTVIKGIEERTTDVPALKKGEIEKVYESQLNSAQCAAVFALTGPVLVIAGAGSGKTRTIVYRTAYMLQKGIKPESILLLTFTRRAAGEMTKRVNELIGSELADKITAGTFHSFANLQLRKYGRFIGIMPNFTICDTVDSADMIDLIKNTLDIKKIGKTMPKKGTIAEIISRSRNHALPIAKVVEDYYSKYTEFADAIKQIAGEYEKYKAERNMLDYDDLLEKFLQLLESSPEVLKKIQNRYEYVMVDEYQDTNIFQGKIADLIAGKSRNIMVVGDDSQSIYAFRGANFENILRFPQKWEDARLIKLFRNYRSERTLLAYTNEIIKNFYVSYEKALVSNIERVGERPVVKRFLAAEDEGEFVASEIEKLLESGIKPEEVAVLYRSSFHANFVQASLLKRGIDFAVYGGIKFVERRHIKDVLSYAKVIQNPKDSVSLNRIFKLVPGIGASTAAKIAESFAEKGAQAIAAHAKKKYYGELVRLCEMLEAASNDELKITKILEIIIEFYKPILEELEDDSDDRLKDFPTLIQLASKYSRLENFLTDFALDPPDSKLSSSKIPADASENRNKVVLSTIHSAKGLEWDTVFVISLNEGSFPSEKSITKIDDLEEERRLFYVACSRAKSRLFLTYPQIKLMYGKLNSTALPSRFLAEISNLYYDIL